MFQVWNVDWKGTGRKALGSVFEGEATETNATSEASTAIAGEHRYEDDYFLKKRPAVADVGIETTETKRAKIDNGGGRLTNQDENSHGEEKKE